MLALLNVARTVLEAEGSSPKADRIEEDMSVAAAESVEAASPVEGLDRREQARDLLKHIWDALKFGDELSAEAASAHLARVLRQEIAEGKPPLTITSIADAWDIASSSPKPTILSRIDGRALLYPGKTHVIGGEPGSGKSMLAVSAGLETIRETGKPVLYADFEASLADLVGRIRDLGGTREEARLIFYVDLNLARMADAMADLIEKVGELDPALVVMDGQAAAMEAAGLDENDNSQATRFARLVLDPVADSGPAVLVIDHVSKQSAAGEVKTSYTRGASAKKAMVSGAAYMLRVVKAFSRECEGELALIVAKDRHGAVGPAGQTVASIRFLPGEANEQSEHPLSISIEVPTGSSHRPTFLMEKASKVIEHGPVAKTALREQMGGKKDYAALAISLLITEGFAVEEKDGRSTLVRSLKPFRQDDEKRSVDNPF